MDLTTLITPLTRQTLSSDVYQQLRELLLNGKVMPGEQLSLRSIATALGVSVMPVREAMHRLVAEQAIELTPNRALRVPVMSVSQFCEITTIRVTLEGLAVANAVARLDAPGLQTIQGLHEDFGREIARKQPDGSRLIALNKELHFAIYRLAGMPVLMQMIESLWLRIGPILNYDLRSGAERVRQRVSVDHHSQILAALVKRDPTAATAALRDDIQGAADFIVSAGVLVSADAVPREAAAAPSPAASSALVSSRRRRAPAP